MTVQNDVDVHENLADYRYVILHDPRAVTLKMCGISVIRRTEADRY